jgi:hypothetical protein
VSNMIPRRCIPSTFPRQECLPLLLNVHPVCPCRADSGIDLISKGIRALDMRAVKALQVDYETLGWPAPYFDAAYKSLVRVLQRPLLLASPGPSKTTPSQQTTVPPNPNFSKESHPSSGSSASCESKSEHFTE